MKVSFRHLLSDIASHMDPSNFAYCGKHHIVPTMICWHPRASALTLMWHHWIQHYRYHRLWRFGWRYCSTPRQRTYKLLTGRIPMLFLLVLHKTITTCHIYHMHRILNTNNDVKGAQDISSQPPRSLEILLSDLTSWSVDRKRSSDLEVKLWMTWASRSQIEDGPRFI